MGVGGEDLVAVIQNLPSGTAVLLLDRKRQELDRKREEMDIRRRLGRWELKELRNSRAPAKSVTPPRRSAGVETEPTPKINTSSQICDGQYASTYQLAHCSLMATSPPVDLTEFPPQRPEPCRTQGNFEVGGFGSGEFYRSRSPSPPSHGFKGGMQWPDRGSVYTSRPQLERDDAFANSLRKYPNAPEGSPSAELVQRLIRNTQAKFAPKTSHHSKSMRNLGDKSPTHSKTNIKKSSKNLQTYTRSKKNEPEREQAIVNYEVRRNNTKQRGFKASGMLQSPGCSKEFRVKETFDYLSNNIPRPPPGKASGDRHAVKDSIRDSLQAVYGDGRGPVATFNLCPRIRSRYEKHRREHHGTGPSRRNSIDEAHGLKVQYSDRQLCEPTCPNFSPKASTSRSKDKVDVTCECDKSEHEINIDKCICRQSNTDINNGHLVSQEKSKVDKCMCEAEVDNCTYPSIKLSIDKCMCHSKKRKLGSCADDIDAEEELEEIVYAWLEELPVSSKEKPNDKSIRCAQTKKLCDTLFCMKDDKFDAKGKEEIKKCIDKMPMWLPYDKDECNNFKNKIADGLFQKLEDFRHRNTFQDVIEDWLDGIVFEDEEVIDRKGLALCFSNALKKLDRIKSSNERLYTKKLKCKILDMLEDLPIQTIGDRNDALEKFTDELIYKLIHSKGVKNSDSNPEKEPYINIIITSLNELPELTELGIEIKQRAAENLLNKLPNSLFERNEDENTEGICGIVRFFIIRNWLLHLAKDNKIEIDNTTQQDFIKDLIFKLEEHASKNNLEQIMGFLRELPMPPDSNDPEIKKMVETLSNEIGTLYDGRSKGSLNQQENEQQLLSTTESWLKNYFEYSGTPEDPSTIPIFAKKLATRLSKPKRKISFSSPMLTEILDLTKTSVLALDDSSNQSNAENMTALESKFNDILENLVLRRKDETMASELMSLLQELELANASGNISNDIYNRLLSRVHELSHSSNNEDIFDFIRDDSGRKVATSTPRRQSHSRDGSPNEEERYQRNKRKDGTRLSFSNDDKQTSYNRGTSKGERQTSPNGDDGRSGQSKSKNKDGSSLSKDISRDGRRSSQSKDISWDERRSSQSKDISGDERRSSQSRDKSENQKQPGTSKGKNTDENNFYEDSRDIIQDWINQLKLNLKNKEKDLVNDIANDLEDRRKYLQVNPNAKTSDEEELEHMKYQIFKRFNKLVDTPTINTIMPKVRILMDNLKEKSGPQSAKLAKPTDRRNNVSGTSTMSHMNDVVRDWCNNLPLPDTTEGDAKRQDIYDKVMMKIGELNMNPKILNDATLYEDMLFDTIDEQLSGLPINTDNTKADLMGNLKPVKEKLKENWAGQAYKQQLHDVITKSSPSTSNLTEDEQASFEIMKDNLADAYINLHYVADDENLKVKFKDKINKEIDRFCENYLNRHPDKPLNASQLNKDLYSALKKVNVPCDESMKFEVELSRMKDIIDDWAEELLLNEKTAVEKLQRNKNSTLLAQRLHELEKENELTPDNQYEEKIGYEIEKYLKKLPLQNKTNLKGTIDKLIDMVKGTEHSRTFTKGSRRSIDDEGSGTQGSRRSMAEGRSGPQTSKQLVDQDRSGPQGSKLLVDQDRSGPQGSKLLVDQDLSGPQGSKLLEDQERRGPQGSNLLVDQRRSGPQGSGLSADKENYDYYKNCAASCLNRADQAHLQRIRERTESPQRKISCPGCQDSKSFSKHASLVRKDAEINSPPLDHGSQVNMEARQPVQCRCSAKSPVIQSPCSSRSQVPMPECRRQSVQVTTGSQIEISPYVVVKEYFWDNPPTPQEPKPPPSPRTPLPAMSSCCILPQNKPSPHRNTSEIDADTCPQPPNTSRNRPQITMQRSFDDDEYIESCRRPMTPRNCGRPVREEYNWECPKDEHNHGSPRRQWSRPHIYRDNEGLSQCYSSDRKPSSVRCGCGGKISRCRVRNPVICQICHDDPMKYCPRCCGTLCPHPTDFYFR